MTQRERALDAAISLLGTEGLRALTHRRIDQMAQLPPGSTSNYFRTRDALLTGVADAILERELTGAGPAFAPSTAEEFLDGLVTLIDRTTGDQRTASTTYPQRQRAELGVPREPQVQHRWFVRCLRADAVGH